MPAAPGARDAPPLVTVVVAAYNRSRVLRHAIRSVVDSTFGDWELIVVGDHCTDDTEACVASFGDPRMRFVNLPENCGDQSGPNNRGVAMARGKYVAFLNQDDLYFPDHLANCVAALDAGDADLVWVPCAAANPAPDAERVVRRWRFELRGVPGADGYDPFEFHSASSWMLRRELADRLGPWPDPDSVYVTTSQAWLFRAWRRGAVLRCVPKVGVLLVFAGFRRGSYEATESSEHDALAARVRKDPRFREEVLQDAALNEASLRRAVALRPRLTDLAKALARPLHALLIARDVHPSSLHMMVRFGRKGGAMRWHRRFTGSH